MSDNDPLPAETPRRKPRDPRDGESFNGPNVEFVLIEGPPDATSGPIPDYLRPYLKALHAGEVGPGEPGAELDDQFVRQCRTNLRAVVRQRHAPWDR